MSFDWIYNFSLTDYILLGALTCVFIYQMYFYLRVMCAPLRRQRKGIPAPIEEKPGVSVIVCARNELDNLSDFLQSLLSQDYPEYEVIVINDGSEDKSQDFLDILHTRYPNLRLTFVPFGAHIRSTKKLALTLGAKAAKYEYLLMTDADCRPESNHWIAAMMQGFQGETTEIVLGFGAYFVQKTSINRLIQYDTLFNGLQYMGRAIAGHPYMGVGRNLAYRKETFFRHGGFSKMLDYKAGDDDLFVNRYAKKKNTQVVCSTDSITWSVPKQSCNDWWVQKRRHLSVSPHYRFASRMMLGLEPLSRAIFYGLLIATGLLCPWQIAAAAGALFIIRILVQMIVLDTAGRRFRTRTFGLWVLWYDILLPVISGIILLLPKRNNW